MQVAVLAGGIGAARFLTGLVDAMGSIHQHPQSPSSATRQTTSGCSVCKSAPTSTV